MSGIYILYLEGEIVGFSHGPRDLDENVDEVFGPIALELIAVAPRLLQHFTALCAASDMDCPKDDAWKHLLKSCRDIIKEAQGEQT